MLSFLFVVALIGFFGQPTLSAGNVGSVVMDNLRVTKCAKCFYMDGGLPLSLDRYVPMPGQQDGRCKKWNDGIPESQYETCEEPFEGEANACMFLNMTVVIKNIVTQTIGNGLGQVNGAVGSVFNSPIGNILGVSGTTQNPISSIGSFFNAPPSQPRRPVNPFGGFSFGRKKRQADWTSNILNVGSSAIGGAVSAIPGMDQVQKELIKLPGFIPSDNGQYTYKIYYKGCVKLSLLETLSGPNCRLAPEFDDIKFFSQQTLLQPFMDLINTLNTGLSGFGGVNNTVDGLCYINKKEFTKKIWKSLLHYDPAGSSGTGGISNPFPF